jgi:mono/diheme cytochrome c family protein
MKTMLILALLAATARADDDAASLFEKRILPIFKSPNPSSCAQCHLAGVDLKNYILPSHEKTFLSLRDQGLIDLDQPAESKILRFISRGGENAGAALIQEKTRKAELEAFAGWIKASCADPKLRNAPKLAASEIAKPKRPDEVIRHARVDKVAEAFEKNVWSQRFRCFACHAAEGGQNAKLVKENGETMTWIRPEGPEATLKHLLAGKLVNAKAPEQSLMLTKPTGQASPPAR